MPEAITEKNRFVTAINKHDIDWLQVRHLPVLSNVMPEEPQRRVPHQAREVIISGTPPHSSHWFPLCQKTKNNNKIVKGATTPRVSGGRGTTRCWVHAPTVILSSTSTAVVAAIMMVPRGCFCRQRRCSAADARGRRRRWLLQRHARLAGRGRWSMTRVGRTPEEERTLWQGGDKRRRSRAPKSTGVSALTCLRSCWMLMQFLLLLLPTTVRRRLALHGPNGGERYTRSTVWCNGLIKEHNSRGGNVTSVRFSRAVNFGMGVRTSAAAKYARRPGLRGRCGEFKDQTFLSYKNIFIPKKQR